MTAKSTGHSLWNTCRWFAVLVAALFLWIAVSARAAEPAMTPDTIAQARAEEFPVTVSDRTITVRVLSPPEGKLAADPALVLTFAMDRATSLSARPYCFAAEYFLEQGHRAASFDLPAHGDRIDARGSAIEGMRNRFVAGDYPFAGFVEDGKAVIDECIKRGLAKPGRIAVAGTSRGGYMALRLLAGDRRVAAGAGFAPVTDWRELREFAADKDRADVAALQLANFIPGMLGKQVYVAIGKTDTRVGTRRCQEFVDALTKASSDAGGKAASVEFHLTDDGGHSCGEEWYDRGRRFLLQSTLEVCVMGTAARAK